MSTDDSLHDDEKAHGQPDWYLENGLLVYTAAYHLKRGYCCGSGCRHCPYEPRHVEGGRVCGLSSPVCPASTVFPKG